MTNTPDTFNQMIIDTGESVGALRDITDDITTGYGHGGMDLLDVLGGIRLIELAAIQARAAVVRRARAEGYTWQEVADTLGISRQAAWERFS